MIYDIIIIGGGPAGLTAANNTSHRGLKTLVIEGKKNCGGQPFNIFPQKIIKDHPGFPNGITGKELSQRLFDQAMSAGAEVKIEEEAIMLKQNKRNFSVTTDKSKYLSRKVIIATGLLNLPRKHPILDQKKNEHINHNILNHDYKDKRAIIVGGGDSAFDNALQLADIAKNVKIVIMEAYPKAKKETVNLAKKKGIKILLNTEIAGVEIRNENIKALNVKKKNSLLKLEADEIIVCIGYISSKKFLSSFNLTLNKDGSVKVNHEFETNIKGVFATGDVTGEIKLIAVACAEGISAAIHAFEEIKKPYWLH